MRLKATKPGQYISLIREGQEFDVPKDDEAMFSKPVKKDGKVVSKMASWVEVVPEEAPKKAPEKE